MAACFGDSMLIMKNIEHAINLMDTINTNASNSRIVLTVIICHLHTLPGEKSLWLKHVNLSRLAFESLNSGVKIVFINFAPDELASKIVRGDCA